MYSSKINRFYASAFFLLAICAMLLPAKELRAQTWQKINAPIAGNLTVLDSMQFAVVSQDTLAVTHNGGATWTLRPIPAGKYQISTMKMLRGKIIAFEDVYVLNYTYWVYQILFETTDDGLTWSSRSIALSNTSPDYQSGMVSDWGNRWYYAKLSDRYAFDLIDGTTGQYCGSAAPYLESADFRNSNIGMLSTGSELLKTTNGGKDWLSLRKGPYFSAVHFVANAWLVLADGRLLSSTDDGVSWLERNLANRKLREVGSSDSLIILTTFSDYALFSTDHAQTWQAASLADSLKTYSKIIVAADKSVFLIDQKSIRRLTKYPNLHDAVASTKHEIDVGTRPMGTDTSFALTLYNVGQDTLRISGVVSSSPLLTVSNFSSVIAPADSSQILVTFRIQSPTIDTAFLRVTSNGSESPLLIRLIGRASVPVLSYSSRIIDFGPVEIGTGQVQNLDVRTMYWTPDLIKVIQAPEIPFTSERPEIPSSSSRRIRLSFTPTAVGPFASVVLIGSVGNVPDSIILVGEGVTPRSGNMVLDWKSPIGRNEAKLLALRQNQTLLVFGTSGNKTSASLQLSTLDLSGKLISEREVVNKVTNKSLLRIASSSDNNIFALSYLSGSTLVTAGLISTGDVKWKDSSSVSTRDGTAAPLLAVNNDGSLCLLHKNYYYSRETWGYDIPSFTNVSLFSADGHRDKSYSIASDVKIFDAIRSEKRRGAADASVLLLVGDRFITNMTYDTLAKEPDWRSAIGDQSDPQSRIIELGQDSPRVLQAEDNLSGAELLTSSDVHLYTAGQYSYHPILRYGAKRMWLVESYDLLGKPEFRKEFPFNDFSTLRQLAADDKSIFLLGQEFSASDGQDLKLRRFDLDGNLLWTRTFNGLGSQDDSAQRIILINHEPTILLNSRNDSVTEPVLLSFDTAGVERFRLRLDPGFASQLVGTNDGRFYVTVLEQDSLSYVYALRDTTRSIIKPRDPGPLSIQVSPNPWSSRIRVYLSESITDGVVELRDLLGRVIWNSPINSSIIDIDPGPLPAGSFTVSVHDGTGQRAAAHVIKDP